MSFTGIIQASASIFRNAHRLAPAALLLLPLFLIPTVEARPNPTADVRPVPTDEYGRPVIDDYGRRIIYGEVETHEAEERHSPERPVRDEAPPSDERPNRRPAFPTTNKLVNPSNLSLEWYDTIFGTHIGTAGLEVCDLNGDGTPEIVAGARSFSTFGEYWYVLQENGGTYEKLWSSLPSNNLDSLTTADLDGDGDHEVIVGDEDVLRIYGGLDPVELSTFPTVASSIRDLAVGDIDGDGNPEAVFHDLSNLYAYDLVTGAFEYSRSGIDGDIALANVDADADLEILVAEISLGYVLDGPTGATEWTYSSTFGEFVDAADLNGDGRAEIAFADSWQKVGVIDSTLQAEIWSVTPNQNVDALHLLDGDGDGDLDLLYGDGQWGDLYSHDALTGALLWQRDNPEHGVTRIEVADVDLDGTLELLWGNGASSSSADYLQVVDATTGTLEWLSQHHDGPFYGFAAGDVDGDGTTEFLITTESTESGYADGLYFVRSGASKALEYQSPEPTGSDFNGAWRIGRAQVDGDPQEEIFFTSSSGYTGLLIAYDGLTHQQEWSAQLVSGQAYRALAIADVDGDGALEVITANGTEHTGSPGNFVQVYNAATGTLEWQSAVLATGFVDFNYLRIADVDADPALEIVVASKDRYYRVIDGVTGVTEVSTIDLNLTALETADRDGDGKDEIYLGYSTGTVSRVDIATGSPVETVLTLPGEVRALRFDDIDSDGALDLIAAAGQTLALADGGSGQVVWSDLGLSPTLGAYDSLLVADIDDDGRRELVVNVGAGVRVYDSGYIANHAPTLTLLSPTDGDTFFEGGTVNLNATASDTEDGDLTASIQWSSDLDGSLGSGGNLSLTNLSLGQHQLTATVTDSGGLSDSQTVGVEIASLLEFGLVGHWTLDDGSGTTAADSSGNGHDGTLLDGTWTNGKISGALDFDGTNDGIDFAAIPELDAPSAFTFAAWIRHDASTQFRSIFDKRDAGTDGYDLYLTNSSRAFIRVNTATLTGNAIVADGTWHHVAAVYDGSSMVLYVDGVEDAAAMVSPSAINTTATLRIGHHFSSNDFRFAGTLDDARAYARALSLTEIQTLYDYQGQPDGRAPERSNGGPMGTLPPGTTNVVLTLDTSENATCRYDTVAGTAFSSMTTTFLTTGSTSHAQDVNVVEGNSYTYYVRCQDGAGNTNEDDFTITFTVDVPLDLTTGLVGYWKLDELTGTTAADSSGNGYNATTAGSPQWNPAQVNGGLTFDGVDDGAQTGSAPLLDAPTHLTLSAWVNHGATNAFRSIIDKRDAGTDGYDLYLTDTSRAFVRINQETLTGATVLTSGTWHHIAAVWDGSTVTLYVNGVLNASKSVSTTLSTTGALRIGEHFSVNDYRFDGTLDEVRVYDRALNAAEVQGLVNYTDP